ncbi:MAG: type IV pilus secretin PilQ [Gammaproteobacteria bacterium]|nr:type IV pilus secretin PilQ [Gammaproteobacteria bacterium]
MKRIFPRHGTAMLCAAAMLIGGSLSGAWAAPSTTRTLNSIQTISLGGGKVEVDLELSAPPPQPISFSVNQPAMIVLDLPGTASALEKSSQIVNVGGITRIDTASTSGKTRVVIHLTDMVGYQTEAKGDHIYLTLGGATHQVAAGKAGAQQTFGPVSGASPGAAPQSGAITDVTFHRTPGGAGRIEVTLSGASVAGNVKREGDRVIVTFPETDVPARLVERLNVTDFATPVTAVTTRNTQAGARVTIQTSEPFEQLAYQANNTFAVVLKPDSAQQKAAATIAEKQYTGEKLTLNFQSIPVRSVLQILAEFTGKNIVVSGSVNGNITLRLHDVPWDEALDIILKTQGLAMRKVGDVIMIAPAVEFARQEKARLQAQSQVNKLVPLRTAYLQVNYAKAADLAALIQAQKNSLLSDRGTVTTDKRTNTLIVRDTPSHISQVRKLVSVLDIPVQQVLIESRIVIAQNTYERDLGVRFGATGVAVGDSSTIVTTGSLDGTSTMLNGKTGGAPGPYPVPPDLNDRLNVNLPVSPAAGQFAISILNSAFQLDLELSAMQAEGKGKVVSSPRVITADQQTATIEQGVEIPYQNASSSGATAVQFKKAVMSLEVTPQITPDERILMAIEVHKDSVGKFVPTANGGQVPSIDTRTVTTSVLVNNGDTVVLGGIYEIEQSHSTNKVPILGDIPILGYLFRSTTTVNNKKELLIFVTPKILSSELSRR